jgi:hypothetical protein
MPAIAISDLPAAITVSSADLIPIVQGGTTKYGNVGQLPGGSGVAASGVIPLVNGQSYIDVAFGTAQSNANWIFVECGVVNTIDASPLNIWPGITTSKTATGFRVQLNGLPDSNNYFLHWAIAPGTAPAATTYSLSGPSSGLVSVASTPFTVALVPSGSTLAAPVIITPSAGGGGGTFTPTTVSLTTAAPSATFVYTPASTGTKTISVTNSDGLTNPGSLSYVATVPFDPSTIAGLKLWLKADSMAVADGTLLTAWNDSSSNAYNLGNGGGTQRPTFKTNIVNGKPVVRFDGVANRMFNAVSIAINQPNDVFVVASGNISSMHTGLMWAIGQQLLILQTSGNLYMFAGSVQQDSVNHGGGFHVFNALFNFGASYGLVDGSIVLGPSDPGGTLLQAIYLMSDSTNTYFSTGDYAELLIYNSALSAPDRTSVTNYLKTKYGIP